MKIQIRNLDAFQSLNPHDVIAYLRAAGWREVATSPEHSSWSYRAHGEKIEAFVPLDRSFRDFDLRLADVVPTIAAVEARSQLDVLGDLQEAGADVIRLRLKQADAAGGTILLLDRGVPLFESALELMLAAACACATDNPRARYSTKKQEAAVECVRKLRLGQSERGSYVVKILSRVQPALKSQPTLFGELEEPFERRVVQTLGRALRAVRTAADRALALKQAFAPARCPQQNPKNSKSLGFSAVFDELCSFHPPQQERDFE